MSSSVQENHTAQHSHASARASIVHPALLESFDEGDWFYPWQPWEWPQEDRDHRLVQTAIEEGWSEWIESNADLEAVKQGYVYDVSRDRHGQAVYWHCGSWVRWQDTPGGGRQLIKIPIEIAEDPDDPEIIYFGRGDIACRFVELFFCYTKESMASEPGANYRLIHWQRKALLTVFGWVRHDIDKRGKSVRIRRYRQALFEISKKNGKSDLGSIVTILLIYGDNTRKAYVYGVAGSKDQAGIVFREARDYVQQSPDLAAELFVNDSRTDRKISHFGSGSFYEVVAADAFRNDGYDAHGVIFDELHQQKNRQLYVVFRRSGQARLQPLEFVITTYGSTLKCIWGEVHLKAKAILQERRIKISQFVMIASAEEIPVVLMEPADQGDTLLHVRRLEQPIDAGEVIDFSSSGAGSNVQAVTTEPAKRFQRFLVVEPLAGDLPRYSEGMANENPLDPDRLDHAIRRANPSVDIVTPHERIKEEILDAEGPLGEAEAKRFNLNIIAGDGQLWLPGAAWMACGRKKVLMSSLLRQRCFGGLDLSQVNDLTAFWLAFPNWKYGQRFGRVKEPLVRLVGLVWVVSHEIERREEVEEVPYRALAEQRYLGRFGPVRICEGTTIDYEQVGQEIVEVCEYFKLNGIGYDPAFSRFVIDPYLEPAGLRCYPHRQGALSMAPAALRFENMVKKHQIQHGAHPLLDAAVEGCVLKSSDDVDNRYPSKKKSTSRIDPLVAAIMANGWACDPPEESSSAGAWSGEKGSGVFG